MADTQDWSAFNPQPAPATAAPASPFGTRAIIEGPPPQPKTSYRQLSADEIRSRGLDPTHSYQISSEGSVSDLGSTNGGQPKLDVSQAQTAGFYQRALNANNLYGQGVPPRSAATQTFVDLFPQGVVRSFESDARKNAETAAAEFVAATLRKESGAAISPQEFESQYARYFPQPGDGPEQIRLKAGLRQQALEAMKLGAGPGLPAQAQTQLSEKPATGVGFKLTPQQQTAYDALVASGANADQIRALIQTFGGRAENADAVVAARDKGAGFVPANEAIYNLPQELQQRVDERLANTTAGGAAVAGGADTVTAGTFDELSALGDAFGDALNGKGFNYQGNLAANRQFQDRLQQRDPAAYLGGQLAGGLLLPTFGANDAASLAKVGAGYGGAYGFGSGEGDGRITNALLGAGTGAAVGYAVPKVAGALASPFRRGADVPPPLVDPATGELNAPMDAMRPAARVQTMNEVGLNTVTPGMAGGRTARVLEQGFNNVPGSAGVMEDVNSAVAGELRGAANKVADKFGTASTLNEAGTAAQQGAKDYISRFQQTSGKAYDAIPISPAAKASTSATQATLESLTQRFASNPELAAQMNSPKIQQMLDAIKSNGLSWQDLKALRTSIGEAIGERRFSDSTATSDLRSVYAALTEDMKNTAAATGQKASRAFERANTLYREGQQRIDGALVTILGNDSMKNPEKAAQAIQAMTKSRGGDLGRLAQVRASLVKSGAWDDVASALIRLGGLPSGGEGRAFNPQTFVQWYSDMTEPARRLLFKPELRKSLDQFVSVAQQAARVKGLTNTSNTTPTMIGSGVIAAGGLAAMTNPATLIPIIGGGIANNIMARAWTSPKFVSLITGYTKAAATGNQNAVRSQIGRLQKLAVTNPELRGGIEALLKNIANDNAVSQVAASPDAQSNQQQ